MTDQSPALDARQRRFEALGILMTIHAYPDEVSDKYGLAECVVPPGMGAPPNHHAGETETFYIIDGDVEFMIAGETIHAGAGESVRVPNGAVHAFKAIGSGPARVMIINAPGQMHAGFFSELGTPVDDCRTHPESMDGPPDVAHVVAVAEKWGMTILAPAEA